MQLLEIERRVFLEMHEKVTELLLQLQLDTSLESARADGESPDEQTREMEIEQHMRLVAFKKGIVTRLESLHIEILEAKEPQTPGGARAR